MLLARKGYKVLVVDRASFPSEHLEAIRRMPDTYESDDLIAQHIPAKRFLVRSWQETGELPLWCPYSFAGAPFVHDIQVAAFYPPQAILYCLTADLVGPALCWLVVAHVILAGWCMYAYARFKALTPFGAFVAALGYMLAGKWMLHLLAAGHYNLAPLAWVPLVLLCLEHAIRSGRIRWAADWPGPWASRWDERQATSTLPVS